MDEAPGPREGVLRGKRGAARAQKEVQGPSEEKQVHRKTRSGGPPVVVRGGNGSPRGGEVFCRRPDEDELVRDPLRYYRRRHDTIPKVKPRSEDEKRKYTYWVQRFAFSRGELEGGVRHTTTTYVLIPLSQKSKPVDALPVSVYCTSSYSESQPHACKRVGCIPPLRRHRGVQVRRTILGSRPLASRGSYM